MKPRFFALLAIGSLVLCVGTVALWIRSWHYGQSIERVDPQRRIVITSIWGIIQLTRWDGRFQSPTSAVFTLNSPPLGAWQRWMYWRGRNVGDTGPADSAYQPDFSGLDHWWQQAGFDAFNRQCKPTCKATALHDWLQPSQWSGRLWSVAVPYWAIVVVFSILPGALVLRGIARTHRSRAGHCPICGYDLRATPHRCPECGTHPP
jgi:hypothetical protein